MNRKLKNILWVIVAVFSMVRSFAAENTAYYDTLYSAANSAYQEQKFDSALGLYSEILNAGLESPDLYYNLGNTYYKLNQIPQAILYYEKALKLNPGSPDAKYNLDLANKQIVDKIEQLPMPFYTEWKLALINVFSFDTWGFISIALLIVAMVWLMLYFFTLNSTLKRVSFYLFVVFLLATGATYWAASAQAKQVYETPHAVIFATRTNVYSAPNTGSTVLFIIHSGLKVKILKSEAQWYNIMLPDGSVGWIPEEVAETI